MNTRSHEVWMGRQEEWRKCCCYCENSREELRCSLMNNSMLLIISPQCTHLNRSNFISEIHLSTESMKKWFDQNEFPAWTSDCSHENWDNLMIIFKRLRMNFQIIVVHENIQDMKKVCPTFSLNAQTEKHLSNQFVFGTHLESGKKLFAKRRDIISR